MVQLYLLHLILQIITFKIEQNVYYNNNTTRSSLSSMFIIKLNADNFLLAKNIQYELLTRNTLHRGIEK